MGNNAQLTASGTIARMSLYASRAEPIATAINPTSDKLRGGHPGAAVLTTFYADSCFRHLVATFL